MPPLIIKLTELSQKILTMTKCKHQKMFFVTDASSVFPCLFISIVPENKLERLPTLQFLIFCSATTCI